MRHFEYAAAFMMTVAVLTAQEPRRLVLEEFMLLEGADSQVTHPAIRYRKLRSRTVSAPRMASNIPGISQKGRARARTPASGQSRHLK